MLKRMRRSGWWICGIRDPESVAEHSWRATLMASLLALMEGADASRAALLAAWHDFPETRMGDLSRVARFYHQPLDARVVAADQIRGLPPVVEAQIASIVQEFEACQTLEARCAHDADKLECLAQAQEYLSQGFAGARDWIAHCQTKLQTSAAQELASSVTQTSISDWYRTFVDAKFAP